MDDFHRRLGDGDFHVIEEITLDDTHHVAHHSGFYDVPKQNNTSPELKILLQNISNNEAFYSVEVNEIEYTSIENGDIIEVKFFKDYKQKDISIVMRFFIKTKYTSSILGFLYILDESNGFDSKARAEKLTLPIIHKGKRKISLTDPKSEAIIVATEHFFYESRIKEIKIYKNGQKQEGIKGFFKNKIGGLLKK